MIKNYKEIIIIRILTIMVVMIIRIISIFIIGIKVMIMSKSDYCNDDNLGNNNNDKKDDEYNYDKYSKTALSIS